MMLRRFRRRSASTGRFVTEADVAREPGSTITETVSDAPQVEANLRWRIGELVTALIQAGAQLESAARAMSKTDVDAGRRLSQASADAYRVARDHIPEEEA